MLLTGGDDMTRVANPVSESLFTLKWLSDLVQFFKQKVSFDTLAVRFTQLIKQKPALLLRMNGLSKDMTRYFLKSNS